MAMIPRRVLVVDDDPAMQAVLTDWLSRAGHQVTVCAGMQEAQQILRRLEPDVMLIDVRLGAFNGLQLLIEARDRYGNLPVIVMSGFEDNVIRRDAERYGAVFLTKPIARADLFACIDRLTGGPPAA